MERVTINYQSPNAETLKRAQDWIRDFADPAHPIFDEATMSDVVTTARALAVSLK